MVMVRVWQRGERRWEWGGCEELTGGVGHLGDFVLEVIVGTDDVLAGVLYHGFRDAFDDAVTQFVAILPFGCIAHGLVSVDLVYQVYESSRSLDVVLLRCFFRTHEQWFHPTVVHRGLC